MIYVCMCYCFIEQCFNTRCIRPLRGLIRGRTSSCVGLGTFRPFSYTLYSTVPLWVAGKWYFHSKDIWKRNEPIKYCIYATFSSKKAFKKVKLAILIPPSPPLPRGPRVPVCVWGREAPRPSPPPKLTFSLILRGRGDSSFLLRGGGGTWG